MTTTTVLAVGYELSYQYIADGWLGYTNVDELVDHPRYDELIEALVQATKEAGDAMLPEGVYWYPYTSEIIGPVGADLGDDFDRGDGWSAAAFAEAASKAVDYDAIEAEIFGQEDQEDILVQVETSDDGYIWRAVDAPAPVSETGFTGSPEQVADAAAADYASSLEHEGVGAGSMVRAVITRVINREWRETLAVSDVYVVEASA